MIEKLTRFAAILGIVAAAFCLVACNVQGEPAASSDAGRSDAAAPSSPEGSSISHYVKTDEDKHIIGVAVYNAFDDEVVMFHRYLVEYIAGICFDDVEFVYSGSISSEEELIEFIDDVAELGGEGIMSFYNIDLKAEVERCAQHGMYHIVASGSVSDEDFASVEDNDYFLGVIGPQGEVEYAAGNEMARSFIERESGSRYFIMSGGSALGNEMHYQRTLGMLDAIEAGYGIDLGDNEQLARSDEPVIVTAGDVVVAIAPGYLSRAAMKDAVENALDPDAYDVVLSTVPVEPIYAKMRNTGLKIGQVDCYSQNNQIMFASGQLDYLVGKYGSLVGPSFAAMYNAVTGHADAFRDNGKAFKIKQVFWSSQSARDFNEKYELASNVTTPAYNYEDLYSICCTYNPSASLEDLVSLASACSYDDAKARRG